jgi:hypothetical protein
MRRVGIPCDARDPVRESEGAEAAPSDDVPYTDGSIGRAGDKILPGLWVGVEGSDGGCVAEVLGGEGLREGEEIERVRELGEKGVWVDLHSAVPNARKHEEVHVPLILVAESGRKRWNVTECIKSGTRMANKKEMKGKKVPLREKIQVTIFRSCILPLLLLFVVQQVFKGWVV